MATVATAWKAPGVAEAEEQERQYREESYLGLPSVCAGVRIRQITPRLLNLLSVIGSPFVNGGHLSIAHALQFLWTLSSDLKEESRASRRYRAKWEESYFRFVVRRFDWEYVFESIAEFLDQTFLDAPTGTDSTPYASSSAWIEYRMADDPFRWDYETKTADTPLRRIYQLLRCHQITSGDLTVTNKLSGRKYAEWMEMAARNPEMVLQAQKEAMNG